MSSIERELTKQYSKLQQRLREQQAKTRALPPEDERLHDEYAQMVQVARQLLAFEDGQPARLAESKRQLSERITLWSWRCQSLVAAGLIALVFILDHTLWWLVLLLPHFMAMLAGSFQKVTADNYRRHRVAACGVHVLGALAALVSLSVISTWFILPLLAGWLIFAITAEGVLDASTKGRYA